MTRPTVAGGVLLVLLAPPAPAFPPIPAPPRLDAHGHPLPPGAVARLGDYARRYGDARSFSFSPDGRLLARSREFGTDIREADTGRDVTPGPVRRLAGEVTFTPAGDLFHADPRAGTYQLLDAATGAVRIDVSAAGRVLDRVQHLPAGDGFVAVVRDGPEPAEVRLFPTGEGVRPAGRKLADCPAEVMSFAYSPAGGWVAVNAAPGRIRVYTPAGPDPVRTFEYGPDGNINRPLLALPDGETLLVGQDAVVLPVRITPDGIGKGDPIATGPVGQLELAPDGKSVLASAAGVGCCRIQWPGGAVAERYAPAPGGLRQFVGASPDGRRAVWTEWLRQPFVVDVGTDRTVYRYEGHGPTPAFWVRPGGRVLVGDQTAVYDYELATGREVGRRRLPDLPPNQHMRAFSRDGRRLAATSRTTPDRLTVWDVESGAALWHRDYPGEQLVVVAFTADGRRVSAAGQVRTDLLDAGTGAEVVTVPAGTAVVVSSDGRLMVAGSQPPFSVIEVATGKVRLAVGGPASGGLAVVRLRLSADGRFLAGFGPGAAVWSLAGGELLHSMPNRDDGNGFVTGAISADGRWLAQPTGWSGVRVWDWAAGRAASKEFQLEAGRVTGVAFTSDGKYLLTSDYDGTVLVWDVARFAGRSRRPVERAAPNDLWADLGLADAEAAGKAVAGLVGRPVEAVAVARRELRPAVAPDPARLDRLVAELADDANDTRDRAERELVALADLARPDLQRAAKSDPPERRRRADRLLTRLDGPVRDPDRLRVVRAVEVVERVGTPAARALLAEWAAGAEPALLTREAKAAADRLAGR